MTFLSLILSSVKWDEDNAYLLMLLWRSEVIMHVKQPVILGRGINTSHELVPKIIHI